MLSTESNMTSIEPKAELPLVQAPLTNAMPTRPPRAPTKNLTGIYLGSETKHAPQGVKHSVPPLARGRGMPSHRVRTPTEQRRYRKVELLRIKEEKRGFSGNPLRRKASSQELQQIDTEERSFQQSAPKQPNFWHITKQNARHYTASTNTGITRFEYLAPEQAEQFFEDTAPSHPPSLAQEIHQAAITKEDLSGIVDCYKKVCRGNFAALQHLLPQRRVVYANSPKQTSRATGFTVKSYRNPNQAEIIASFPPAEARPKTAQTPGYSQRPYVPGPYFFKSYQPPQTAGEKSLGKDYSPYAADNTIFSVPGAGALSRSVPRGRQHTSPRAQTPLVPQHLTHHRHREGTPLAPTTTPTPSRSYADSAHLNASGIVEVALPKVDSTQSESAKADTPLKEASNTEELAETTQNVRDESGEEKIAEEKVDQTGDKDAIQPISDKLAQQGNSAENMNEKEQVEHNTEPTENPNVGDSTSTNAKQEQSAEIMIGLEDESGEQKPVEIDETDEALASEEMDESPAEAVAQQGRRVSITERVLKSKNSEQQLQTLKKTAEDRKRELAELLSEHAQLVHQVSSLEEVTSPSADKENATFETPPPGEKETSHDSTTKTQV